MSIGVNRGMAVLFMLFMPLEIVRENIRNTRSKVGGEGFGYYYQFSDSKSWTPMCRNRQILDHGMAIAVHYFPKRRIKGRVYL